MTPAWHAKYKGSGKVEYPCIRVIGLENRVFEEPWCLLKDYNHRVKQNRMQSVY